MRRVTAERLDVSFTGISSRVDSAIRSLVSPLSRDSRITYSIPIYDIPELAELREDSYYHRIGFARIEQVLTHVDEKIPTIVLVPIEERVL